MTHRFFPLIHRILSFSFIVFISLAATVSAQVIIREKVILRPKLQEISNKGIGVRKTSSVTSGFVMTKKGVVEMFYGGAQRLGKSIPTLAKLVVHRLRVDTLKADTVMIDSILGRYPAPTFSWNNTTGCFPDPDSQWNCATPNQPFSAMNVRIGDTVQFVYITTDNVINGQIDTLEIAQTDTIAPFGWNVTIGRWDACRSTWSDMVSGFIGVADTTITFTQPVSNTVYPRYPRHNNSTDKNDTLDLQLQVTFNSSPIKNYWVKIDTTTLADSGGHSHDGNRPLGTFLLPRTPPQSGYDSVRTFTRQTDSTGSVHFKYVASKFGDIERIKARRLSDTTSFDTLRLTTSVSGLVQMPSSSDYSLTGAPPGSRHPSNHWIKPVARDSLIRGAQKFLHAKWNRTGERMRLNDMSLEYGGGLDIFGAWTADVDSPACKTRGHCSHREGTDVDIENLSSLKKLIDAFDRKGWTYKKEPAGQTSRYPHFRFE